MTTNAQAPRVRLDVDGAYYSTTFAERLAGTAHRAAQPDIYGDGEVISECEAMLAGLLGKERAILFPTGTLANLIALDRLCPRTARRVLLHPESHIFNDMGDALGQVAGLTPIGASAIGAGFEVGSVLEAAQIARAGKVAQRVGAIAIETPVRRLRNAAFPPDLLAEVISAAKSENIGCHLDGARLPIAAAAASQTMAEFSKPFDTVYLSLWKMLGLPFGAVLAGSAATLEGCEDDRRRLGGALPQFWPIAVVVLDELKTLESRWVATLQWADNLQSALRDLEVAMEPVGEARTNSFWLRTGDLTAVRIKSNCSHFDIALGEWVAGRVLVRTNPTVLSSDAGEVALHLREALTGLPIDDIREVSMR